VQDLPFFPDDASDEIEVEEDVDVVSAVAKRPGGLLLFANTDGIPNTVNQDSVFL
jgi:hypothetical protein